MTPGSAASPSTRDRTGATYVLDWTDTGECHNYKEVDRTNGRIYKVTYGKPTPWHGDIAKLSDAELVALQLHKNDWQVRHARRVLQERAAVGELEAGTQERLRTILSENPDVTRKLRALWTLHATGGLDEAALGKLLASPQEEIRAWTVRLGLEGCRPSAGLRRRVRCPGREGHLGGSAACSRFRPARLTAGRAAWSIAEKFGPPTADGMQRRHTLPLMT